MTQFDLPLDLLQEYLPERDEPADLDSFWAQTLAESRQYPLDAHFERFDSGLSLVETFDVTYNGYAGQPIKGWLILPRHRTGPLPCLVEFIGYTGGRGHVYDWLTYAVAGYAHFVMDTRGQGSSGRPGHTPDVETEPSNSQVGGFMTRGVLHPRTYYYRRVYTDAVRAIEAARSHEAVDASRVGVTGGSQGGAITLAAAALQPDVAVAMPDVPFLCHIRKATEITDMDPYNEIVRYCKTNRDKIEQVFQTISYFDCMNLVPRAKAPALFSVALRDEICPPRTVYAAYNHYSGPKHMKVWQYNNHEGGQAFQTEAKIEFLRQLWGSVQA